MNFIKQIFKGEVDERAHQRFIRYGRGQFPGPVLEVKKQGKKIKAKGSAEYVDMFGLIIAKNSGGIFNASGKIFAKKDLEDELSGLNLNVQKKSKKGKLKVYQIKTDVDTETLRKIYELDAVALLSLVPEEKSALKLKSKSKLPGPGDVNDSFCSAAFDISMLECVMDELCFDVDTRDFKKINISHKYIINELVAPEDVEDLAKLRIQAKRKGRIIRNVNVDDEEIVVDEELLV